VLTSVALFDINRCICMSSRLLTAALSKTKEQQINSVLSLCRRLAVLNIVVISLRNRQEKDKKGRGKSLTSNSGVAQCCLIALNIQQWIFAQIFYEVRLCS